MRLRTLTISVLLAMLAAGIVAAPATAKDPSLASLKHRLRHTQKMRDRARDRSRTAAANLAGARELFAATNATGTATPEPSPTAIAAPAGMSQKLAAALLADGVVTADEVASVRARATAKRRIARRWTAKVRRLQRHVRELKRIATWNRQGRWKPLIAIAAKRYGVGSAGLYRMMMLESSGQRHVDSGPYHGLFQFMHSEWSRSWNEWRDHSIYDGWSQIQLAAKCISRGMGPSIWPLTYRMAF